MAEQNTSAQPVGKQSAAPMPAPVAPHIAGQPVTMDQLPASSPAVANAGHYTRDGKLTRAGMEHVIRSGGSVVHEGKVYSKMEHLPSEADLAKGDADAEAAALENINRQRAQLDAQEAQLKASKPSKK